MDATWRGVGSLIGSCQAWGGWGVSCQAWGGCGVLYQAWGVGPNGEVKDGNRSWDARHSDMRQNMILG